MDMGIDATDYWLWEGNTARTLGTFLVICFHVREALLAFSLSILYVANYDEWREF